MKYRELKPDEYELLKDFLYEAIFIPEGTEAPDRSIIELPELAVYYEDFGSGPADYCMVADDDGHVVGAVWSRIMNDYGHIDDETPSLAISVLKEYRDKGIGTRLLQEMLLLLKKQGYKRVSLSVQKANYAAGMYEKAGFVIAGENDEEYLMVRELQKSVEEGEVLYQDGEVKLAKEGEHLRLAVGEISYELSSNLYEPCMYIETAEGHAICIHNSFTVDEICRAAQTGGSIRMITGNEYDTRGVCMLLRKAIELNRASVYIHYVEGCCFMDCLKEQGAISPETAVDLTAAGMKNPRMMNTFIHSKHVGKTDDGSFWIIKEILTVPEITYEIDNETTDAETDVDRGEEDSVVEYNDTFSRVISNQVRFGYGYRTELGKRQYYAWHGYPNRNDDFITIAEISKAEFFMIEDEYPRDIDADRDTAEAFRNKYVNGHKVIKEGWNINF